jgi:hypothetical protein
MLTTPPLPPVLLPATCCCWCWCCHSYPDIYLFQFFNMRNEKFKELRDELKDSSRCALGAGAGGRCGEMGEQ